MTGLDLAFIIIFGLFAIEVIFGRFVPWVFNLCRDWMDVRDRVLYEDDDSPE